MLMICGATELYSLRSLSTLLDVSCGFVVVQVQVLVPMDSNDPGNASLQSVGI